MELKIHVELFDQEGEVILTQPIVYRNLPNAYFKCHKQGHFIKDCIGFTKAKALEVDTEGFTYIG